MLCCAMKKKHKLRVRHSEARRTGDGWPDPPSDPPPPAPCRYWAALLCANPFFGPPPTALRPTLALHACLPVAAERVLLNVCCSSSVGLDCGVRRQTRARRGGGGVRRGARARAQARALRPAAHARTPRGGRARAGAHRCGGGERELRRHSDERLPWRRAGARGIPPETTECLLCLKGGMAIPSNITREAWQSLVILEGKEVDPL